MNAETLLPAFDWLGPRTGRVLAAVGLVMLAAYLASVVFFPKPDGRIVIGDAVQHYVQLRSVVGDGDLDFRNDYAAIYGLDLDTPEADAWMDERRTPTGYIHNLMPVGPALLWAPLFVLAAAGVWLLRIAGIAISPQSADRLLEMTPGVTGIVAATLAAVVAARLARRFADDRSAAVGALGVWLGSHAIYYSLVSPAYSHAASMLASGLVFAHWLAARAHWNAPHAAASGALIGAAALMRWQDALLLTLPLVESLRMRVPLPRRAASALAAAAACVAVFTPQMAVWHVLYGQPLAIPQGASFMEWTAPNLLDVLVSDNHGLFTWSPVLVPAAWGVVTLLRRERALALPVGLVVALSWYVNAAVSDWWAGEAYGARRFLSLFPLFVVGLAVWVRPALDAGRLGRVAVVGALVAANGLLFVQYQAFMKGLRDVAPYPRGFVDLWLTRFVVPFRLLARWMG
jgi:hypothetical protein